MYYLYEFLNENNEIIYIGKATNLIERLRGHNHLPKECYKLTKDIRYTELNNESDMHILELYLINTIHPIYNIAENSTIDSPTFKIEYSFNWKNIDLDLFNLEQFRSKHVLTEEEYKERQRIGIERAKNAGLYKGRKSNQLENNPAFINDVHAYLNGELKAVDVMRKYNVSSPTFYRKLQVLGIKSRSKT